MWAQSSATIVGRVSDPSGATVGGATVTARNIATGLERSTVSGESGDYELPLLPVTGSYSLTISKTGFSPQELTGIVLQVQQQARFDVTLKLGSLSEKVIVAESAPMVNTDSGAIGQVINNKSIVDLPLNGRNFTQLASLVPNAVVQTSGTAGSTVVSVSGGRLSKTEFRLDGIGINEQLFDGVAIRPSVDAIQEFKILSNSFSAEYGRGDAVLIATIKGGTNQYHGVVYEFLRNDKLDARNTFLPKKAAYRQNQFGGSFGGPIVKDKTFFFLNYEGTRIRQGRASSPVVPSSAFRNGDFSSLSTPILDPLTKIQFPGNIIPANRINAATSSFLKFIPLPTTAAGTAPYAAPFSSDADQANVRLDQRLGSKNTLFVRESYGRRNDFNPGAYPQNGGFTQDNRTHNAVVSDTHIFSPTVINELRLGYTRFYNANINQGLGTNYTTQAGIGGFELTSLNFPGFPQLSISGFAGINGNAFQPLINPTDAYEIVENVHWIKGAHTLTLGTDLRQLRFTSTNSAFSRGSFNFTGAYTGNGFADFLTGYPLSGTRDFPRNQFGEYDDRYHFYVQDDWKVNSHLTLNLGLRYELNLPPDFLKGQAARFDFVTNRIQVMNQANGQINLTTQQVAQFAYPAFKDVFQSPKDAGLPNNLIFTDKRDWAPRLGLAYRPFNDNKTVVRAGFGLFYLATSGNNTVSVPVINAPFIVDESLNQPTVNGFPTRQIQTFFPPFSSSANFQTPLAFGFDPHMVTPRVTQYNIAVQRELAANFAVEVAYLGSQSHHLEREVQPANFPPINPNDNRPLQQRLPNPRFAVGDYFDTSGNANYNGLEVKLEKRYSHGYQFVLGYNWSKNIDMDTNDSGSGGSDNPYNYRTMRGPSGIDFGQRFVGSFVLELPVGRGKRFASQLPGAVNAIVGGWQLAGIVTFQGGFPFTPTLGSADPTNSGRNYGLRPNVGGTGAVPNPSRDQWFNIADFPIPAKFTIGNAGRNILRGPGLSNQDLSLLKDFHFSESKFLEFRLEYFNVANITNLSNPNTSVDLPAVGGRIFSTSTAARIGQVAMKFYF
ncbi:MAG: carboxypeptidase regulatory-like domain-containing protein [Acidobacteriota bacterium]|nr:carboxypeptidase regulatory-like domain-containing protein [Acidobacteriota bacterium]